MLCARGRHAPQPESLAFSVRLHSWGGWRRWKWERKGWNGVGLQLTRPTVLLNEITAFSWHLFTNSCTQNLLAQRASGESVFGCPTENLLVPGNRMGGNFEPWYENFLLLFIVKRYLSYDGCWAYYILCSLDFQGKATKHWAFCMILVGQLCQVSSLRHVRPSALHWRNTWL